jgi:hypothetical protein
MINRRPIILVLLCLACQSCGSDAEKFNKEIEEAISWLASARMVSDAYANGTTPEGYTRKALASFQNELQSSAKRMETISDPRKQLALAALKQSDQTLVELQTKFGDRAWFSQLNLQLANQQTSIAASANPKAPPNTR